MGEGGVGVAVSWDGGGTGDVGDAGVVEGDAALTGKGVLGVSYYLRRWRCWRSLRRRVGLKGERKEV